MRGQQSPSLFAVIRHGYFTVFVLNKNNNLNLKFLKSHAVKECSGVTRTQVVPWCAVALPLPTASATTTENQRCCTCAMIQSKKNSDGISSND